MGIIDSTAIPDPRVEGLSYLVQVVPDTDVSPGEFGLYPESAYTQSQYDAWKRDEWSYVGVIVTPIIAGEQYERFSDSLWGVEYGYYLLTDEQGNETGRVNIDVGKLITEHPVPDMITEVRSQIAANLSPVIAKLQAVLSELDNETEGNWHA